MKEQLKVPIVIVAVIALVGLIFVLGKRAMGAGDLDQGQVQYTPGVPPWEEKDPSKRLPGGPPPVNGTGTPAPGATSGAPAGGQGMAGQGGNPALPPGMAPPAINNGGAQGK